MAHFIGLIVLALLVVGCQGNVQVEAIDPQNVLTADPSGNVPEGAENLFGRVFENAYGTIEFLQANASAVQVLESCRQDESLCAAIHRETSADFVLQMNDRASVYTHSVQNRILRTRVSGSADRLILTTEIQDANAGTFSTIREIFELQDDPCKLGGGPGLQAKQNVKSVNPEGQSSSSEACQAYY